MGIVQSTESVGVAPARSVAPGAATPGGTATTATTEELEQRLGARIRSLRLSQNLDQAAVAAKSGVSLRTVKNLEAGRGSSVATLVRVVRALGRSDWLDLLEPAVAISPLRMLAQERRASVPQRASRPRKRATGAEGTN